MVIKLRKATDRDCFCMFFVVFSSITVKLQTLTKEGE